MSVRFVPGVLSSCTPYTCKKRSEPIYALFCSMPQIELLPVYPNSVVRSSLSPIIACLKCQWDGSAATPPPSPLSCASPDSILVLSCNSCLESLVFITCLYHFSRKRPHYYVSIIFLERNYFIICFNHFSREGPLYYMSQ